MGNSDKNQDQNTLLRTHDVAAITGFSTRALESMRHRGRGPDWLRIGRSIRYRAVDVTAWINASSSAESRE